MRSCSAYDAFSENECLSPSKGRQRYTNGANCDKVWPINHRTYVRAYHSKTCTVEYKTYFCSRWCR